MYKKIALLVIAGLLLVGLGACAGTVPQTIVEKEVIVTVEVEKVDEAELERRKTLIMDFEGGKPADPENFNPYKASGRGNQFGMVQVLSEPLFNVNLITGQLDPWLAESMAPNEDFSVWTLTLRDGVKWSDGEAFNADDIVFTIEMYQTNPDLNTPLDFEGVTVEKVDDLTVTFTLPESDPRFQLTRFGGTGDVKTFYTVPEHIWKDQDDPVTFTNYDPEQGWPVFTGPYKVASVTDTNFAYERDENWWGLEAGFQDLPAPEKIVWTFYGTEETRAAAMAKNDLDQMALPSPAAFETMRVLNDKVRAWSEEPPFGLPDICTRNLEFNTTVPPWDDPEMRWAINYAIDRAQIVDIAYSGMAAPSRNFMPNFPALKRYVDLIDFDKYPIETYDPELTKSILESKGWELNSSTGYYEKDGEELKVTIINFDDTIINSLNGVLVEQLQTVGINATQDIQTIPNFIDNVLNGNFEQIIFFGTCGSSLDPWTSLDAFSTRHLPPEGEPIAGFYNNAWRWDTENAQQYSELVDEIGKLQPGDPQIDQLFVEAMDYLYEDLPSIPLIQNPIIWAVNETYWTNWPTEESPYIQPDMTGNAAHAVFHNLEPAQPE